MSSALEARAGTPRQWCKRLDERRPESAHRVVIQRVGNRRPATLRAGVAARCGNAAARLLLIRSEGMASAAGISEADEETKCGMQKMKLKHQTCKVKLAGLCARASRALRRDARRWLGAGAVWRGRCRMHASAPRDASHRAPPRITIA
jgi:hypothetical protein